MEVFTYIRCKAYVRKHPPPKYRRIRFRIPAFLILETFGESMDTNSKRYWNPLKRKWGGGRPKMLEGFSESNKKIPFLTKLLKDDIKLQELDQVTDFII